MIQENQLRTIRRRRGVGAAAMRMLDRDARTPRLLDAPFNSVATDGSEDQAGQVQAGLRGMRVVVVGLGSIGSHVADLLARASVGSLLLVDRSDVKPESILTHPLPPTGIGRSKARLAGERAKAISPDTLVRVFEGAVEELGLEAFLGADALVLSSDNLACEREVSQRCLHLGVPLLQASVHGPTLVAQVRALANRDGATDPCLACGYEKADWEALDRGTIFSCAGGPPQRSQVPTVSPAHLCALAASLVLTELHVRSVGLVDAAESRLVEYCGFTHCTVVSPLERRAECPTDHATWRLERWAGRLAAATPRELLRAAGCVPAGGAAALAIGSLPGADRSKGLKNASQAPSLADSEPLHGASLRVPGLRFTGLGSCDCDRHPSIGRFFAAGSEPAPCPACGHPLVPHPFHTHDTVPAAALRAHLDHPLATLGAGAASSVLVRGATGATLFHSASDSSGRTTR